MTELEETLHEGQACTSGAVRGLSLLAAFFLLVSGGTYRLFTGELQRLASVKVIPPQPLSELPMAIGAWNGEDVPLADSVLKVARNDDYISRRYTNEESGEVIELYVSYTARPRTMLGHRPTVCYPSHGWIHERTGESEIVTHERRIPCLLHTFSQPELGGVRVFVVNYYIVEGRETIDERTFRGISWRDPNLERDPKRYVTQVQITASIRTDVSTATRTTMAFARASAGPLLALLQEGRGNNT